MKKATKTQAKDTKVKEIAALRRMKDQAIDTSDLPQMTNWTGAEIGKFFRPIKKPLTIRLDADVLAWLKSQGKGYQTRINTLLRKAMTRQAHRY